MRVARRDNSEECTTKVWYFKCHSNQFTRFFFCFSTIIWMLAEDKWVSPKCQLYIYGRYMISFVACTWLLSHDRQNWVQHWICEINKQTKRTKPMKKRNRFMLTQSLWDGDDIIKTSVILNYWTLNWTGVRMCVECVYVCWCHGLC